MASDQICLCIGLVKQSSGVKLVSGRLFCGFQGYLPEDQVDVILPTNGFYTAITRAKEELY